MDPEDLNTIHFPILMSAEHVITKSASHLGSVVHLRPASKQRYLQDQGEERKIHWEIVPTLSFVIAGAEKSGRS
jgi:hypothetical protein